MRWTRFPALGEAAKQGGVPDTTLFFVQLRASQINSCSVCVDIHTRALELAGESSERIHLVAAWREAPYFSDAERRVDREHRAGNGRGPTRPPSRHLAAGPRAAEY